MDLLTPNVGLLFWMSLTFIVVFIILLKYGFTAIVKMVNERKLFIDDSLRKAHEANEKLTNIQKDLHKKNGILQRFINKDKDLVNVKLGGEDEEYLKLDLQILGKWLFIK